MATRTLLAALTMAGFALLTSGASAQQAAVSNEDLLSRIEQLESALGAQSEGGDEGYMGYDDPLRGGFFARYEAVFLKPHFTRDAAYMIEDAGGLDGYSEVSFNWDLSLSNRIEFGYLPDDEYLGFRTRYWQFDDELALNATNATGDIYAGFGGDSEDMSIEGSGDATFVRSLAMDVIDLELASRHSNWTAFGGLRYARMKQRYNGFDNESTDAFFSSHNFEGLGMTAGLEIIYNVSGGFSLFAKTRGSLLFGSTHFDAYDRVDDDRFSHTNRNDMIAAAELQAGIDWRTDLGSGNILFFTLAAESQYWLNAGTGASTINAVYDEINYQNGHAQDADLGFIGFAASAGFIY